MTDILLNGLVSLVLSSATYLLGRKMERSKISSQDMDTVQKANQMIAPLLLSGEELSKKIQELRIESDNSRKKFVDKIQELEASVEDFNRKAAACTCGAFPKQIMS